ncbi:MAG: hypothetical protein J3R72DRAFT_446289 [Linnemannia gamsii]|nr:MAG: hypothetical protein J3R72DRAFT_446289 [Linnemannia gamsii]
MDSRSSYNPVRPLVIALCVILILSLVLSCVRRRRILAFQQQQLAQQQNQTTELGDVAYIYQYPPPVGTPSSMYQPGGGQGLYAPPPGVPGMSQPIAGSYYTPAGGVDGQQQQQPFPQAHFAYPPMPLPTNGATSSTSTTTTMYVAPQDGSANLTNADISEGVPAIPPPPYTATVPK